MKNFLGVGYAILSPYLEEGYRMLVAKCLHQPHVTCLVAVLGQQTQQRLASENNNNNIVTDRLVMCRVQPILV